MITSQCGRDLPFASTDKIPSCIRLPPPEALITINQRQVLSRGSFNQASQFSPTTEPMLTMIKAESVMPTATRRARIIPVPTGSHLLSLSVFVPRQVDPRKIFCQRNQADLKRVNQRPTLRNVPSSNNWSIRSRPRRTGDNRTRAGIQPLFDNLVKDRRRTARHCCHRPSGTPRLARFIAGAELFRAKIVQELWQCLALGMMSSVRGTALPVTGHILVQAGVPENLYQPQNSRSFPGIYCLN